MVGPLEFATAARIRFGAGVVQEVPAAAKNMGKRALLVTGANLERASGLRKALEASGVGTAPLAISGEPTVHAIQAGVEFARSEGCSVVIAMGGGSALDAGKALAAMLTNPGDLMEFLEVVGQGHPLPEPAAPFIAIPTTAGTGAEVTRNAVLASPEHRVKASLRSASMLPRLALVDPELTHALPRAMTATTGLDALTQLIEPYTSIRANAMVDMFALEGIRNAAWALPRACENGADAEARSAMAWASLLGGLSLANAGLGAVHGFAAPVGGMFPAPHGAVCAAILPHAMAVNVRAMRERQPENPALERYATIARILTGKAGATPEDAAEWVAGLTTRLEIQPLRVYGVTEAVAATIVEKAARASSMKGNPVALLPEELTEILSRSL